MNRFRALAAVALFAVAALLAPAASQADPPDAGSSTAPQYHWQWGG
jgi:hypothetical protein